MYFKIVLSRALAARMFSGVEPFMQLWKGGTFMQNYFNLDWWFIRRSHLKKQITENGHKEDDGQRPITIAHL